jgi:hypothetical protein
MECVKAFKTFKLIHLELQRRGNQRDNIEQNGMKTNGIKQNDEQPFCILQNDYIDQRESSQGFCL